MNLDSILLSKYVSNEVIKKSEANKAAIDLKNGGVNLREYLYKTLNVTELAELKALGDFYDMPYIELDMLKIDKSLFDCFSLDYMKRHNIIPVMKTIRGELIVAIGKPLDLSTRKSMRAIYCGPTYFILTSPSQISRRIDTVSAEKLMNKALTDIHEKINEKYSGQETTVVSENFTDNTVDNPTVRLVDSIIREAIPLRASDIHIEPFERIVRVRYRIDGDLIEKTDFPIAAFPAISTRLKIMSGINIAERRIPQDGRIGMTVNGIDYDFRVSTLPSVNGEKFVIRILDKTAFNFTREDLGFTKEENKLVDNMLARPHGIILLTGPTGCGKSTTLYSFLKEVNDIAVNIVTVEDPVEYSMEGITQTQVNVKASMTFAAALRSILRQDPDIIMIGEIRDEETAEISVRAAITGHLVFSTLHTNDAPGAVSRLEDMHIPDYLISDSLVGVIAQRLVKKLCPACRKKVRTTPKEMEILGLSHPRNIYHPVGCQYCNHTGYKGRMAVHEIMYVNNEMKNCILQTKNLEELRKMAVKNGMVTLWESCKAMVLRGETSIQELFSLKIE